MNAVKTIIAFESPPEFVRAHQDDAGEDGDEEPRLLVLDNREADDRKSGGHQGQREHVPDVRLASPLVIDCLGDPVDDCDHPDGSQGPEQEGQVDQDVRVPGMLPVTGHVTRHQVVHHKVEWSNLENVFL